MNKVILLTIILVAASLMVGCAQEKQASEQKPANTVEEEQIAQEVPSQDSQGTEVTQEDLDKLAEELEHMEFDDLEGFSE